MGAVFMAARIAKWLPRQATMEDSEVQTLLSCVPVRLAVAVSVRRASERWQANSAKGLASLMLAHCPSARPDHALDPIRRYEYALVTRTQ